MSDDEDGLMSNKKQKDGASGDPQDEERTGCLNAWEGDQFIWTKEELKEYNKKASKEDQITPVFRDPE